MNSSEKMSYLIVDTQSKCKEMGHRMDWRRYSDHIAEAECLDCTAWVIVISTSLSIRFAAVIEAQGSAIMSDCIHKTIERIEKEGI